jgi:hypothetical protein
MRIYEGSPRQDFEEVFRSIGAFLDQRAMKEVLLAEAPDGFIVQGLVTGGGAEGQWSESLGRQVKETLTFLDDDIARFMDEALTRRKAAADAVATAGEAGSSEDSRSVGSYERAFRVLGKYMDQQKPQDVFFFEQDGAFVVRLLMGDQKGSHHVLAEFTRDDITAMVDQGPAFRHQPQPATPGAPGTSAAT